MFQETHESPSFKEYREDVNTLLELHSSFGLGMFPHADSKILTCFRAGAVAEVVVQGIMAETMIDEGIGIPTNRERQQIEVEARLFSEPTQMSAEELEHTGLFYV